MKVFLISTLIILTSYSWGQTIYHPKTSKTVVKVKSGESYHYFDTGGPNDTYAANTSSLITIYPEKKGEYVSMKCGSLELASDCRMYIFDGNHPGAAIIGYFNGKVGIKNQSYTASSENSSGAISIRFVSLHRRAPWPGWDFTVSTSKTPGTPISSSTSDCSGAIKVCSDSALTTKASGKGIQELPGPGFWSGTINNGKDGEIQSNWYKFEVKTPGTIEFLITPNTFTDFDWGLWGPYDAHECPAWTTDMYYRASACDGNFQKGLTGLNSSISRPVGRFDTDECFVAAIDVKAGEHYVIMIDDWSGKSSTFKLSWTFLNGASLECEEDEDPPEVPEDEIIDTVIPEVDSSAFEVIDIPIPETPKIEAEISRDEQFVTVKYPGPFEWKIENMNNETVRTGNSVDEEEVDVSNLPAGTYRVSLIYKKIKQYTSFVKN